MIMMIQSSRIDDEAESKSKIEFMEESACRMLWLGFKFNVKFLFVDVSLKPLWYMIGTCVYSIHFTCENGHNYSWQTRKTKLEQTLSRMKHFMTYTQFVEFFPLLVFMYP